MISDRDTDPSPAMRSNSDPCSAARGRTQLPSVDTSRSVSAEPVLVCTLTDTVPTAFKYAGTYPDGASSEDTSLRDSASRLTSCDTSSARTPSSVIGNWSSSQVSALLPKDSILSSTFPSESDTSRMISASPLFTKPLMLPIAASTDSASFSPLRLSCAALS